MVFGISFKARRSVAVEHCLALRVVASPCDVVRGYRGWTPLSNPALYCIVQWACTVETSKTPQWLIPTLKIWGKNVRDDRAHAAQCWQDCTRSLQKQSLLVIKTSTLKFLFDCQRREDWNNILDQSSNVWMKGKIPTNNYKKPVFSYSVPNP